MNKRTIEMVMHNPPALPRTFEDDLKKELCNNYAFADKNGFYCTACKKYYKKQTGRLVDNEYNHKIELVAERKHRDVGMCPFCLNQVKKYDAWRGRKTLERKEYIVVLQNKAGGAFIRSFYICIDYDINVSDEPRITYSEDKRIFLRNGESLILNRAGYSFYEPYWGEYPDSRYCSFDNVNNSKHYFYQVDKIREPRMNRLPGLTIRDKPTHYFYFNDSNLKNTSLKYAKLDKYRNFEPGVCDEDKLLVLFLYYSNKYPVIEKLLLEGFEMIVRQFVNFKNGYSHYYSSKFKGRIFNFRRSTVTEVFKCNKAELREIKEKIPNSLARTQSAIIEELFFIKNKISVTDAYYLRSTDIIYHQKQLDLLHKYRSYHKIVKYFKQQNLETFRDYNDYLILLDRLNIDKDNENTLFPSNFKAAHDNAVQRLQELLDKEMRKKFEKKVKNFEKKFLNKYLKKYSYSNDSLVIKPFVSIGEIYRESQEQDNCVYSCYCDEYLSGKTVLLAVRKKEQLNKSFVTVELSLNDELIQCRAYHNTSAPLEVKEFMNEFLDFIHNSKNLKKERKAS